MVGYIYLNTDLKTGKQYTGKHHYNKEGELDPNYHGSGVLWMKVLKKRPKELIKEEYIKTCYSEEEMNSDEQYYIKLFKTLYPNGYNLTEGGEGCVASEETRKKISLVHKGKHISEEQKKKLSIALKGRIMSDEHKKKIGEASKGRHHSEESKKKMSDSKKGLQSGEKHPMFGKHHSEETRRKMSENHYDCSGEKHPMFGKHHTEESKKKMSLSKKGKPLTEKQLEKRKGLFVGEKNPMYGKKHTEETRKKISAKHKGKPSHNKGKHLSEETKKKISAANKGKPKWSDEARRKMSITRKGKTNGKKSKKVLQFTLDDEFVKEWPSTAECGRNGFNSGYISACCRGEHKSAYGFKWCYA